MDRAEICELLLAHAGRIAGTQRGPIPSAIVVVDEDYALRLCQIDEELEPAPTGPGKLRHELEPREQLRPTRHGYQPVLAYAQAISQELVKVPLISRVAAMHDDNACLARQPVR